MENNRIERLLALILIGQMKGTSTKEKASRLSIAGFSNVEIADILQTTSSFVAHALYIDRKGKAKKKSTASHKKI